MPVITPNARVATTATTDGNFTQPRMTVTRSTGMELPSLAKPPELETKSAGALETGQSDITEETDSKEVTLSPQLTALARKQQKLQQEIQAQRDRESAWSAKEADYVPKSAFKAKLQQNAVEALKELGMDYNEITELVLSQQQAPDPVKELQAKIEQLESNQKESVSKQYEATLKHYRSETDALVASDPKYLAIRKEGAEQAVVQHILETWEEDTSKEPMTVEKAAQEIESFLREEIKAKALLHKELEPEETEAPNQKTLPPPKASARTLTQQVESAPTRTYNQFQHLSPKERLAQAIARAQK